MKILSKINKTWLISILLIVLTLGSFFLRLWNLGAIKEQIFDEVYFVTFAKNYLTGTSFFDIHPPLGKLILAIGIKIFGGQEFSWRIMPAIFGTALIPLGFLAGKELKNSVVGLFAAGIYALDGMILVYSRVGLIDIFMTFFVLLSFYLFLRFANSKKIVFLALAGIGLGLAVSIKYIGGLIFLIFIFIAAVKKIPFKKYNWLFLLFLVIVPLLIYLGFFLFNFSPNSQFFSQVIEWHKQSLNYNLNLTEGHPYGSRWWTWFLLLRPIWLYFKDSGGKFIGIDGMGNPLAWWSSLAIVPLLIWGVYKRDKTSLLILGTFLILLLPWAFFKRVLFIYHALPAFTILVLGIAYFLEKLSKIRLGKIYIGLYFAVLIFLFIYFLPIWIGIPLTPASFYHRIWLKGWI